MVTNRSAPTATIVPILIYEDVGRASSGSARRSGSLNIFGLNATELLAMRNSRSRKVASCLAGKVDPIVFHMAMAMKCPSTFT